MGIDAKGAAMTTASISTELKTFARRKWPLENDKLRKSLLAGLLGFTRRRVRSLYEGEKTAVPRAAEIATIERVIGKKLGAAAEQEIDDGRAEYRSAAEIAAGLEALLYGPHASFFGPQVALIRAALLGNRFPPHGGGGGDGSRDQGRDEAGDAAG